MNIKIEGMELKKIDYRKLKPVQGNLKTLSETNYKKLKKSFHEKNLFVPMMVWNDNGDYKILDGHGREKFFQNENVVSLDDKGCETYEIPCLVIEAKSLKDAKEKILILSSQYQTTTEEGFAEFTLDLDESWLAESINFNFLNEKKQSVEKKEKIKDPEIDLNPQFLILIECSHEGEQRDLYNEFLQRGLKCKLIM